MWRDLPSRIVAVAETSGSVPMERVAGTELWRWMRATKRAITKLAGRQPLSDFRYPKVFIEAAKRLVDEQKSKGK